jgi:hypothetical protein
MWMPTFSVGRVRKNGLHSGLLSFIYLVTLTDCIPASSFELPNLELWHYCARMYRENSTFQQSGNSFHTLKITLVDFSLEREARDKLAIVPKEHSAHWCLRSCMDPLSPGLRSGLRTQIEEAASRYRGQMGLCWATSHVNSVRGGLPP